MSDGFYRYGNTAEEMKRLRDELALLKAAQPAEIFGDGNKVWAVFVNKKIAVNQWGVEGVVPVKGAPGNFKHKKIYQISKDDAGWGLGWWRKPNIYDFQRNKIPFEEEIDDEHRLK